MTRAERKAYNRAYYARRREEILAAQQAKREARKARKAANRAAWAAATAGASPSEVAAAPHFTCARCGATFPVRTQGRKRAFGLRIVRLGGRDWCEKCAAARFRRRPDPFGILPEAIQ